jgi:ribose transport system substrate-binding protein
MAFLKNNVASKIPLITQDNDVPDAGVRRCYIGTHNYRAGRAAGALVAKAFPKGATIAIFVGQSDAPNAVERRQGVLDFLAGKKQDEMTDRDPFDATNLKIGPYTLLETRTDGTQEAVCQKIAEDFLTRNPKVDCLVGLWEYNPPALLRAVNKSQLKTKPAIVAFDESYDTLKAIQAGDIVGTIVQDPFNFGYESIKILAALAKNDESVLKNHKNIDKNNNIFIPHRIITKEAGEMTIDGQATRTLFVDDFYKDLKSLKGD